MKVLSLWRGIIDAPDPPDRTMLGITSEVADRHGVTVDELRGPSPKRRCARPRQEAMWLIRQIRCPDGSYRFSHPQIGAWFGGRHHTTAIDQIGVHGRWVKARMVDAADFGGDIG